MGVVSVGWGFGNGLRAELEGNYRTNQVDSATVPGRPPSSSSPWLNTYGAMVNVLYDFRMGRPVVPYIGAGVGYGWNEIQKGTSFGFPSTQTKGEFAYQGILGLAYELGATVTGPRDHPRGPLLRDARPELQGCQPRLAHGVAAGQLEAEQRERLRPARPPLRAVHAAAAAGPGGRCRRLPRPWPAPTWSSSTGTSTT